MTRLTRSARLVAAWHDQMLRLHPSDFREEFGEELGDDFRALCADVQVEHGTLGLAALAIRATTDVARTALRLRRGGPAGSGSDSGWGANAPKGGEEVVGTIVQDALVGIRMLTRRPVFTVAAVGTLALGIGANTLIFSVVNGVLLQPLPFPDSEQLVRVYHANPESGNERGSFSLPDREEWAERTTALSDLAVYSTLPSGLLLTGGDEPVEVRTAYVSGGFFGALRTDALFGRTLADEEEYGDNRVVVLSHGFWERRYGGDRSLVGGEIQLDDMAFRVVGVMPPHFTFPGPDVEAWVFLSIVPPGSIPLQIRQVRFLEAVGRIKPDLTHDQALDELHGVAASLAQDFPEDNENISRAAIVPLRTSLTGDVEATLFVLLGAVGLVLLIACANVANLLLSRAAERGRELQIRRAVGAGRGRLVRQLLTESMLIGLAGGAAGVMLAYWGTDALLSRSGDLVPRATEVGIDGAVLAFSLVVTLASALVSGSVPALQMTRGFESGLNASTRGAGKRSGSGRTWTALVASQVGVATVVVIASGLLLRSLWALQSVDTGLEDARLVGLSLTINDARYPERPDYLAAYDALMARLEATPGVESVASIRFLPLRRDGESREYTPVGVPGFEDRSEFASALQVSPGFFETAGVPLLGGRDFGPDDREETPAVVVVNETLSRLHWAGGDAVGERIEFAGGGTAEIVGVVGDVRQRGLAEDPGPTLYVAQAQNPRRGMAFVIRTASDPVTLLDDVREAVRAVDPDQPIENLAAMDDVVRSSTAQPRFFSVLLAGFALLSLLLASLGIYGVVSHSVSRRVSEIGIRVALGAPRGGLVGMVVGTGMRPVLFGAVAGWLVAIPVMRLLSATLFGVSAADPVTFLAVPLLLGATAFLACWLPAARAARIDPTDALRSE